MKKLIIVTGTLLLPLMISACGTTQVPVQNIPSHLISECQPLSQLKEGDKWADVLLAHAYDIKVHEECSAKIKAIRTYIGVDKE